MKDKIKPSEEVNIPNGQVDKEEPFQSLNDSITALKESGKKNIIEGGVDYVEQYSKMVRYKEYKPNSGYIGFDKKGQVNRHYFNDQSEVLKLIPKSDRYVGLTVFIGKELKSMWFIDGVEDKNLILKEEKPLTDPKQMDIFDVIDKRKKIISYVEEKASNVPIIDVSDEPYKSFVFIEGETKVDEKTAIVLYEQLKNNGTLNTRKIKEKAWLAIDPGASGALVVISHSGRVITHKMPETPTDLFDLIKSIKNEYDVEAHLEKVGGMPGMGGSPMFNFGQGYGHLEMALIALEIRTHTVSPQKWQKTFNIGTKSKLSTTEWKNKLKVKAQQLFPQVKVTLANADALLIGEYARNLK